MIELLKKVALFMRRSNSGRYATANDEGPNTPILRKENYAAIAAHGICRPPARILTREDSERQKRATSAVKPLT